MTNISPKLAKPELLAPAGNFTCLQAAVFSGADAIYLGVEQFNARRGADNFTLETLTEACDFAHIHGAKIFLTVNIAILPHEISEIMELIRQAYRCGVDAFIVQDLGVAKELKRIIPDANLHISTQMNIHNAAGVMACAALGAKRITLARELSLPEIANLVDVAHGLGIEIEIFAHGAICVCYSGQCFMSALIGGRSANRGTCAQACRMAYTLHNKAQRTPLKSEGDHLLSPKDLSTLEILDELVISGADSLKIEGRMKSAEYVSSVVGAYRRTLDAVYEDLCSKQEAGTLVRGLFKAQSSARPSDEDIQAVSEAFSRGFTKGYLKGQRGNSIMSYQRPNNRGMFIGRVTTVDLPGEAPAARATAKGAAKANGHGSHQGKGSMHAKAAQGNKCGRNAGKTKTRSFTLQTKERINRGDVLEVWTQKGHNRVVVDRFEQVKPDQVKIYTDTIAHKQDRVFRLRNAALSFDAKEAQTRVPVSCCVYVRLGAALEISFSAENGCVGRAFGPVVEPAHTKPLDEESVVAHVNRLGNTPFEIEHFHLELDEGAGLGFSQLHATRTEALAALEENLLVAYKSRRLAKTDKQEALQPNYQGKHLVCALVANPACARAAKKAGADLIYINALTYKRGQAMVAGQLSSTVEQAGYPNKCALALGVVDHDLTGNSREERLGLDVWDYVKPNKPVLVESFGALVRANDMEAQVEVGPHLPLLNTEALKCARSFGATKAWLSPELTLGQIKELSQEHILPLGLYVLGRTEMMVTEHCMLMSQGPCDERCTECVRRKSPHYMKDRKGYDMPIITDCLGRSHLYNAVELDLCHLFPELMAAGITNFMVDTTLMNVTETTEAIKRAVRARNLACQSADGLQKTEGATTGLIYRGVN